MNNPNQSDGTKYNSAVVQFSGIKFIRAVIAFLAILVFAFPVKGQTFSGDGNGISGDPYIITTAAQLDEVRNYLSAHFLLANDIDLTGYLAVGGAGYAKWGANGWLPIGNFWPDFFDGSFDGGGKKITGLKIYRPYVAYGVYDRIGLFGDVRDGTIKNLGIENCDITGENQVGGIAGYYYQRNAKSAMTNCYVTGNITGYNSVGGLVGECDYGAPVRNCYSTANINGNNAVGGLIGYNNSSSAIESCYFYNTGSNWYNNTAWDIDRDANIANIWRICSEVTFPYFQWQPGITCIPPTYTADINPVNPFTFKAVHEGYDNTALTQVFTITNTGNQPLTTLIASLNGGATSDFEISVGLSATDINPGGNTATISIRPKSVLAISAIPYTDVLTISGDNGFSLTVNLSFSVIPVAIINAPHIDGPASLNLTTGYAATSTAVYTITGSSPVKVIKLSGDDHITWNNTTKRLDIAAGLPAGVYEIKLRATNNTS